MSTAAPHFTDSLGDIREMQKIRCLLREGGLAFIGLPTGADGVQFNTKRIYGRGRLPLMFAGKSSSRDE